MNTIELISDIELSGLSGPGDKPNYIENVPTLTAQERLSFVRNYASRRAALVARIAAAKRALAGGSKTIDSAAIAAAESELKERENRWVVDIQSMLPTIAKVSPTIAGSIGAAIAARRLLSGNSLGVVQVPLILALFAILSVASVVIFVSWHLIDRWAWEADRAASRSFTKAQIDENNRRVDDGLPPRPIVPDPLPPSPPATAPGSTGAALFSSLSPIALIAAGALALFAFSRK
jgi:hypothetical protein